MSKTQKTAQVKTKLKSTETAPAKRTSAEAAPKKTASSTTATKAAISALPKANTLTKTASRTAIESKNKFRQTDKITAPAAAIKSKPQANIDKAPNSLIPRNTTKPKTENSLTTKNAVPIRKKPVPSKLAEKSQPLRAKHSIAIVEAVKKNAAAANHQKAPTKPNAVLDTFHNVTVTSPPMRKREMPVEVFVKETEPCQEKEPPHEYLAKKLIRKGSRTLEPEEVVVLRRESAKKRLEEQIQAEQGKAHRAPVKEAVAFEVKFEEPPTLQVRERSRSRTRNGDKTETAAEDEQGNYSDDFESYESDFETGSSSQNGSDSDETDATRSHQESEADATDDDASSEESSAADSVGKSTDAHTAEQSEEDESEFTQFPVTVIQKDKERERKLDSGNYEMNSRKHTRLSEISTAANQQQCDSLDTLSAATSEQLDSGISNFEHSSHMELEKNNMAVSYGGYAQFNTRPIMNSRGRELMSKIQFDTLTYTLFDMKPTSYDVYMRTYGQLNTTQSGMQTHEHRMNRDSQTDDSDMRSMWTQHPPQYDIQTVQRLGSGLNCGYTVQNCCGELSQEELSSQINSPQDDFELSLQAISALRHTESNRSVNQQLKQLRKPLDFERLNAFLLNSSLLIARVLSMNSPRRRQSMLETSANMAVSEGHFNLNTRLLDALRVVRVFTNARYNLIITVHESRHDADVYRSDFSNLLMVWSTSDNSKPMRLLSTWSEVCRAEICNDCADIVVCGLRDGSVAMWDLRETYSYCSKLDGSLTHFAATQSIVPSWAGADDAKQLMDLGAVVDVKSFRVPARGGVLPTTMGSYKSIQFTSLNDTGILTIWTLVDTTSSQYALPPSASKHKSKHAQHGRSTKFEYSSPWARVKLIQSAIFDLRDYLKSGALKTPTPFEKTRALFQRNIYNDEVLRELSEHQSDVQQQGQCLQGLRFTSIDTGCERIYVCTNHNFILACSKSLKAERFHKIAIHDSRFLFPTALCVLTNEDFLAVGLSNGSVMILNCNQQKDIVSAEAEELNSAAAAEAQRQLPVAGAAEFETGKSCAIQNIILNERRAPDSAVGSEPSCMARPTTAACIAMITNQKRPFELRVYDQQLVLSGSALRKHLVQSLEMSSDGWRLFALSNGEVRTYDFYLDQELESSTQGSELQRVADIAVAKTVASEQHLLVLNAQNDVEVHLLKQ